jgi:transcription elongation factor Elf1
MPDGYYYFGCTVSFDCPICGRASSEKLVYQARRAEPQRVAGVIAKRAFECQHCGAARENNAGLRINVLPASTEDLRRHGFALPRAA